MLGEDPDIGDPQRSPAPWLRYEDLIEPREVRKLIGVALNVDSREEQVLELSSYALDGTFLTRAHLRTSGDNSAALESGGSIIFEPGKLKAE